MRRLYLGESDLEVSEVCLGTMTWGQQNDERDAREQMAMAVDRGVNFFDVAEMYPTPMRAETQGATEAILGKLLAERDRSRLVIATKATGRGGPRWIRGGGGLDRANLRAAIEGSLRRLAVDCIDLYQLHWPDRTVPKFGDRHFEPDRYQAGAPIAETAAAMAELIREGKIRHYGLSNETPYGVSQFARIAEREGLPKPVSVQNAYNLLNRVFDIHLSETCWHEKTTLLAYSPLGFGFLTGKYRGGARPPGSRLALFATYPQRYLNQPNAEEAIEAYAELAGEYGLTKLALQFIMSRPYPKCAIIGATKLSQLEENLDALAGALPQALIDGVEGVHRRFPNPCP